MKNFKTNHGENNRSPLSVGATFIISSLVIILMILATHSQMDSAATKNNREEAETVCTTSSIVTTEISSTTSSTTSSTRTTTRTTTTTAQTTSTIASTTESQTIAVVTDPPISEPQPEPVQEYVEPQPESQPEPQVQDGVVCTYSDSDVVLLAQLINKEASFNWEGKLAVGSCVLNRASANGQTISQVIYAQGQFTTCWNLGYYTQTDYDAALQILTYGSTDTRIYYFDGCHGDGLNWFYDGNHNYLYGA